MKIINQSWSWEQSPPKDTLKIIERAGRTCYKSEDKITDESAADFVRMIIKNGHYSVLEHVSASVRMITNRGVSHELVRHRLCTVSQESTRYCNYKENMEFIRPVWIDSGFHRFARSLEEAEKAYKGLLSLGWKPQQAREVLPNALKTELVMTANLREWRHILELRTSKKAHPQMRVLMLDVLDGFKLVVPIVFDGIGGTCDD